MKKKAAAVILAIMLLMSACGSTRAGTGASSAPGPGTKTTQAPQTAAPGPEEAQPTQEPQQPAGDELLRLAESYVYQYGDEDGVTLFIGSYPQLSLLSEGYEKLAAALESYNEETKTGCDAFYDQCMDEAREHYQEQPEFFEEMCMYYSSNVKLKVQRAGGGVLSFLEVSESYSGGAHGYTYYSGVNIDALSGEPVRLDSVVSDTGALRELIISRLEEKYPETGAGETAHDYLAEAFPDAEGESSSKLQWTLGYDGLTFYFSPYELAAYANGTLTVKLSFAEAPELFTGAYQDIPDEYVVAVDDFYGLELDLDGSGKMQTLSVYGTDYEDFWYNGVGVQLGGETLTVDELYNFSLESYYVHTAGDELVYVCLSSASDYRSVEVFSIRDGVRRVGGVDECFGQLIRENEGQQEYWNILFTDPGYAVMGKRSNVLSTYFAQRPYSVGEDGLPKALQEFYDAEASYGLSAKRALSFSGENGEMVDVAAGDELSFFRTDCGSYVDMKLPDGRAFRVEADITGWPQLVITAGGEKLPLDECFDGVIFAG